VIFSIVAKVVATLKRDRQPGALIHVQVEQPQLCARLGGLRKREALELVTLAVETHTLRSKTCGWLSPRSSDVIDALAKQKAEIKTDLVKHGVPPAAPLVKTDTSAATTTCASASSR
jgi:hypothetical protein